jgi:hypothetical protein
MHIIVLFFVFGIIWWACGKMGWSRPDPGTPDERYEFSKRGYVLHAIHTMVWLFLGCSFLRWTVPYLWNEYYVVYTVFGLFGSIFTGATTSVFHNLMLEQNPRWRIIQPKERPRGFWRELWDKNNNPKAKW